MRTPRTHLRNGAITALVLVLVLLTTMQPQTGPVLAQQGNPVTIAPTTQDFPIEKGGTVNIPFTVTNSGTVTQTITLSIANPPSSGGSSFSFIFSNNNFQLAPRGGSLAFTVQFTAPASAVSGTIRGIILNVTANPTVGTGTTITSATINFTVSGNTPTLTPTLTQTPTTTPTSTPTTSPTPTVSPGCPDNPDPGEDFGSASRLLVDVQENHGLCDEGDVDFFKFGGVGGKVYTIDITSMDVGLDLVLDLFDEDENLLASNDDFFAKTPPATTPLPATPEGGGITELSPRILSITLPRDGTYYIRVRDSANVGGRNKQYTILVRGESYGPTPSTIAEICRDLYEEDGLPEEAVLLTSNERQPLHRLCPTGDADWVRFFGKAGKVYYIYTDTRPYAANVNGQTEPGADTTMVLVDRDGVSTIALNDDVAISGEGTPTLDSEIRFVPTVDGFYFVQIKNVGDIGNQFIRYDLTLELCIPGNECGRAPGVAGGGGGQPSTPGQPGQPTPAGQATTAPQGTTPSFDSTPTVIPTFEVTPTTTVTTSPTVTDTFTANIGPAEPVTGPVDGFVDPAFSAVWARNDRAVAERRTNRSWLWGPRGLMARAENFAQAATGLRQVEYFDKGRMEINDLNGDRANRYFVTSGLLVTELISGRQQIGEADFVDRGAAHVPIAGDPDDDHGPTYASFASVAGQRANDRTGSMAGEQIGRNGRVSRIAGTPRAETRLVRFVPETGHNIPQVFWEFLNAKGTVYENGAYRQGPLFDWVAVVGYPISEPYWAQVQAGGETRTVLIQPFQRRVLTYSPDNPNGWQVEMGNVGRHYYTWRYSEPLP